MLEIIDSFMSQYNLKVSKCAPLGNGINGATFLVTSDSTDYVIKFLELNEGLIINEIEFMRRLALNKIPVPSIYPNKNSYFITRVGDKLGILSGYCEGTPVKGCNISQTLSENIASHIAKSHSLETDSSRIQAPVF